MADKPVGPDPRKVIARQNFSVERPPNEIDYVREGRYCGVCNYLMDLEKGRQVLVEDGFWDRAFNAYRDGHDLRPEHFGDPAMYSVCEKRGCACHFFSTCEEFREKKTWKKFFRLGKK